jgi:hypothetical protein
LDRGKGRDIGKGLHGEKIVIHHTGKAKDRWKGWERGKKDIL